MAKQKFPPCPKCGKKGLHYADHPHAQGWKNYDKAKCRYCGSRFKVGAPNKASSGLAGTVAAKSDVDQPANR